MRKTVLLVLFLALMLGAFSSAFAQLTGQKYIPGDYATITEAVTDVNAVGIGAGGVTFNIAAGYTELLTGRITLTATGTAGNPIIFQKDPATSGANPLLTAYVGTSGGAATADGMFALSGCDYVTIDGIDLYDPNVANPGWMEYGYGLFKASVSDGAQYNTIKNCTITLNRNNLTSASGALTDGSACITVPNSVLTAPATALTPTVAAGTNSYNKFYANYLTNANYGIAMIGYAAATPFTLGDTGNDIGGSSYATGNMIINFGGGATASFPSAAIRGNNQWDINISYNTINSNNGGGANHPNTLRGIYAQAGTSANANINYNIVTIHGAATGSQLSAIENGIGSTAAGNTININNNHILNCTYNTATTGSFYGIYSNASSAAFINTNNNLVENNTMPGTGGWYGIYVSGSPLTANMNYNVVRNNSKTGASGLMHLVRPNNTTATASYNQIYNNTMPNTSGTSAATIYGIYNFGTPTGETYNNNTIYDLIIAGSNTSTSSTIQGINTNTGSSAIKTINDNIVYGLQYNAAGSATVYGINQALGTATIARNKTYAVSAVGATSVSAGIYLSSGTLNDVYNNIIYDIQSPTSGSLPSVIGIRIAGGTTNNVSYNSCYLNSTGINASFASAGLHITSGTTNEIRNNIFVNESVPGATGRTVAVWKSATGTTNFGANSNKNIYYAGEPDATHLIGYFSTTAYPTLAEYKAALADRDQGSYSENVPFLSKVAPYNLHINPSISTRVEGNAIALAGITTDFDGDTRNASTPDIGADEGNFTAVVAAPGIPVYASPANEAVNVAINAPLIWSANAEGGTPTSYDVYFDTVNPPVAYTNVAVSSYNPAKLFSQTYYWKVIAHNGEGSAEGPVWSFTTANGVPSLTAPADLAVNISVTPTFTWGAVAGVSAYKIKVGTTPGGSDVLNMVSTATNSYAVVTPLAYSTVYYWSVYSVNGAQEVQSAERSFTTMADPVNYAYPYYMDFEEITVAGNLPLYWSKLGTRWTSATAATTYNRAPHSGTDYLTCQYGSTNTDWLFSRPMQLDGAQPYDFGIWYNTDGLSGWASFKMYIGTEATGAAMTTELASVLNPVNMTYAQLTATNWTPPASGVYYVGFQVIANTTPWYMSFDDFSVLETSLNPLPPTNPVPANLAIDQLITGDLAWVNNGVTTKVDVYFSTNQTLVANKDVAARVAFEEIAPLNSFVLGTLNDAYSTTYYWRVVAKNDVDASADSPVWSFTTQADPVVYSFPYTESFDGTTFAPLNWINLKTAGTGTPGIWDRQTAGTSPTCAPHSGAAMARYNCYSYSAGTTGILVSPALALGVDSYQVSFWMYRDNGYPTDADRVNVYANTTPDMTGATLLGTINRSTTLAPVVAANGWYEYKFMIPFSGVNTHMIWEAVSGYGNNIFIDDVSVALAPPEFATLVSPADASVGLGYAGQTLTWAAAVTGNPATGYKVYFGTDNPPATMVSDQGSTTYPTGALAQGATYFWKVVPYNANGDAVNCPVWSFTTRMEMNPNPAENPTPADLAIVNYDGSFPYMQTLSWSAPSAGVTPTGYKLVWGANPVVDLGNVLTTAVEIPAFNTYTWQIIPYYIDGGMRQDGKPVNVSLGTGRSSSSRGDATGCPVWQFTVNASPVWPVEITSIPVGAAIYVNGASSGQITPWTFNMIEGTSATYSVQYAGYTFSPAEYVVTNIMEALSFNFVGTPTPLAIPILTSPANGATGLAYAAGQNLVWQAVSSALPVQYQVYFGTSNPPTLIATISATTWATGALVAGTTYYWQIVADNGLTTSDSAIWSFTTAADPMITTYPHTQGFNDATFPPYGWSTVIGSGTYNWVRRTSSTNPTLTPYSGAGMLFYESYNATSGSNASLISPPLSTPNALNMYTVSFWMYRDSAYLTTADRVEVYVNSNPTPTGATLLGTVNRSRNLAPVVATAGWYQYTFELGVGAGDVKYAILKAISAYGNNMNVDEITFNTLSIAVPPNPAHSPVPANLATNVAANTNLSWTSGGGAPTGYKVYTSLNGVDFTEVADVAVPLYDPAVNFAYSTQYFWKVDPYNSFGYASELVALPVWSFTTMADPVRPLPYLETFNASTSYPANWSGNFSISSTHGNASNGLYRNLWSSATTGFAITAPVGPITENTRLDFEYRYVDYGSYPTVPTTLGAGDRLDIQVSINDGPYETYYTINSANHTPTTAFTTCSVYLSQLRLANAGDIVRVRFDAVWSTGDYYLDIDNVHFKHISTTPYMVVTPASKDFGTVNVGFSASQVFSIKNDGGGTLGINSVAFEGSGVAQYSFVDTNIYPAALTAGEEIFVTVNFHPSTAGTFAAQIVVNDNLTKATTLVPITGDGFDPNFGGGDETTPYGGYYFANNIASAAPTAPYFDWVINQDNAVDPALVVGTTDDGYWGPIPIGFEFLYYGNMYNTVYIGTNGQVTFGEGNSAYSNVGIPTAAAPNNLLALFWDDLNFLPATANIYYGGSPGITFVITYDNVQRYGDPASTLTAQVILYVDGRIRMQYLDVTGNAWTPTIGIENADGTKGVQYHYNGVGGPWGIEGSKIGGIAIVFGNNPMTLPIGLSSFTAILTADMFVKVDWVVESETNHQGYNVLRNTAQELETAIQLNQNIISGGEQNSTQISYSFTDTEVYQNTVYYYWLQSMDLDGATQFFGPLTVTVGTSPENPELPYIPLVTKLMDAYPNPFNPSTNLRFEIKDAGKVSIDIYNTRGQKIRTLENDYAKAGYYQMVWDGKDANGISVGSGVYFYRMNTGKFSDIKKMLLTK